MSGFRNKKQKQEQKGVTHHLTKDELFFLLTLIKNTSLTIKGHQIDKLYKLVLKLQNQYNEFE
jgi:hypothetical protein